MTLSQRQDVLQMIGFISNISVKERTSRAAEVRSDAQPRAEFDLVQEKTQFCSSAASQSSKFLNSPNRLNETVKSVMLTVSEITVTVAFPYALSW